MPGTTVHVKLPESYIPDDLYTKLLWFDPARPWEISASDIMMTVPGTSDKNLGLVLLTDQTVPEDAVLALELPDRRVLDIAGLRWMSFDEFVESARTLVAA